MNRNQIMKLLEKDGSLFNNKILKDFSTIPCFDLGNLSENMKYIVSMFDGEAPNLEICLNNKKLPYNKFIVLLYNDVESTTICLIIDKISESTVGISPVLCYNGFIANMQGYCCMKYVEHLDTWYSYIQSDDINIEEKTVEMFSNTDPIKAYFLVVTFLLKLLQCKNIIVKDESLGNKKNNKRPELNFKSLHIKLNNNLIRYKGKVLESIPFVEANKIGMAGVKRGHFKTYSEETGLLFGKHSGTWWWSPILNTKVPVEYHV